MGLLGARDLLKPFGKKSDRSFAGELPQYMLNSVVKEDDKLWLDFNAVEHANNTASTIPGISGFSPYLHRVIRFVEMEPNSDGVLVSNRQSPEIFITKHPKSYDDVEKSLNRDNFATP